MLLFHNFTFRGFFSNRCTQRKLSGVSKHVRHLLDTKQDILLPAILFATSENNLTYCTVVQQVRSANGLSSSTPEEIFPIRNSIFINSLASLPSENSLLGGLIMNLLVTISILTEFFKGQENIPHFINLGPKK